MGIGWRLEKNGSNLLAGKYTDIAPETRPFASCLCCRSRLELTHKMGNQVAMERKNENTKKRYQRCVSQ